MREIALDTETTGLDPRHGHRIVEIGCVEMINRMRTGKTLHFYLNPERDMPEEAFRVHGLSSEFLKDKPLFKHIAQEFTDFIADSPLVIHNASFDMKFINAELGWVNHPTVELERAVDTLLIARKKFPGSPVSLDALCKRFSIDLSSRTKHGALLDAELLTDVYIGLLGGKQTSLLLVPETVVSTATVTSTVEEQIIVRTFREPRTYAPTEEELALHQEFIAKLKKPLWVALQEEHLSGQG